MHQYRKATDDDIPGICCLIDSEEELFLVYPNGQFPLNPDQVRKLFQTRKELTVLLDDETIIGFANFYHYVKNESAFIGNVIVDKVHRGKGLGKNIVSHMIELGFSQHYFKEIKISVFSDNSRALLLYAGMGFSPYGIEERKNPAGQRVALIHMKLLRNNPN